MPPPKKLKPKLLTPEKLKHKLLMQSQSEGDRQMNRWKDWGNTICPFHHSLNVEGIKNLTGTE